MDTKAAALSATVGAAGAVNTGGAAKGPATAWPADGKFAGFVRRKELAPKLAADLYRVLNSCDVVLLCDDSGSMAQAIVEAPVAGAAAAPKVTTRWAELKRLAAALIEIVALTNAEGLDIYFFNRPVCRGVTSVSGLQGVFAADPDGGTPLLTSLGTIMEEHRVRDGGARAQRELLIVVVTDGEPSDGSKEDLFQLLRSKPANVHVSLAECTDKEEDMAYLDEWDGKIANFDNTDDYREEVARVRAAQGPNFKFDFVDYAVKILLATFVARFFALDQARTPAASQACCAIL
jgi:hypothetical protein